MTDFKKTQTKNKSAKRILLSGLVTVGIILIISLIAAMILKSKESSSAAIKTYSLVVIVVSAVISGFVNSKREGMRESVFSALLISFLMLLLGLIISGGKISTGVFMNYGCFFLVSFAGAYLGRKRPSKPHSHRR